MTKDEALKLTLEFANDIQRGKYKGNSETIIATIKAALEAKDEPVAWIYKGEKSFDGNKWSEEYELTASKQVALWKDKDAKPLYTTPPQRTWVGLTDEEIKAFDTWHDNREEEVGWVNPSEIVAYIEAKLKEKNS